MTKYLFTHFFCLFKQMQCRWLDTGNSLVSPAHFVSRGSIVRVQRKEMFAINTLNSLKLRTCMDPNLFTDIFLHCFYLNNLRSIFRNTFRKLTWLILS